MVKNNPFTHQIIHFKTINFPHIKYFALITLLLFLSISTAGCVTLADPEASQEYNSEAVGVLDGQTSLGQSFISRRPNLNTFTLWVTSSSGQVNAAKSFLPKIIKVRLYHNIGDANPIFYTNIITPASANNQPVSVNIPGLNDPAGQSYYLLLSVDTGTIQINGRLEDAYPHGQAYINSNPVDAEL
jgi:hypothetical protein